MRERDVEAYLVNAVRRLRGVAYKFTSPGRRSVPDRHVRIPRETPCPACGSGSHEFYVETKAPGAKLTPAQFLEHARLRELGARVYTADSKERVDEALRWGREP